MKRVDRDRNQALFGRRTATSNARLLAADGAQRRADQTSDSSFSGLPWPTRAHIRMTAGPLVLLVLLLLSTPRTMAQDDVRVDCKPRTVRVVPGQPVRLELTIRALTAVPIRLHVPADPQLVLRAVEKHPVRRTRKGIIVHKRVIIWQALEPGTVKVNAISVETRGRKRLFPEVTITVSDPGT